MTTVGSRWLGAGMLAGGCAGLLSVASLLNAASAFGENTALIMGSAFQPTPEPSYITEVMNHFVDPTNPLFDGQPVFPGYNPIAITTPETDYGQGITQGVADLHTALGQQIEDGNNVVVVGYSMSAAIATQEMVNLAALAPGDQPDPSQLQFVLIEDLNKPNGGFFTSFPSSSDLPATPADSIYHTDIYSLEYSSASDFPRYPLNLLADANALDAYLYLHPFLLPGWPTPLTSSALTSALADAVQQPTSPGYDGNTDYYMIPTQNLPLLEGLRATPVVGPAFADLIQPDLRVLVDLGYDRSAPVDVTSPVTLTNPNIDWSIVAHNLQLGAQQGMTAFQVDLGMLPASQLPNLYPYLPDLAGLQSGSTVIGLVPPSAEAEASSFSTLLGDLNAYLPGAGTEFSSFF
ncbi:MAG: PE-PPE domain-containing protein [Mycobacterium sp.]